MWPALAAEKRARCGHATELQRGRAQSASVRDVRPTPRWPARRQGCLPPPWRTQRRVAAPLPGLVIGHLPISVPVAIVCGLFMRAAARCSSCSSLPPTSPIRSAPTRAAPTRPRRSRARRRRRPPAHRLARRGAAPPAPDRTSADLPACSVVVFLPLAMLGSRIFPGPGGGSLFCGLVSFSMGLAIVGSPPADSRSIRARCTAASSSTTRIFTFAPPSPSTS